MNKNSMDKIKKLIDKESKGEAIIFMSEAGAYVNGNAVDLVSLFTMLTGSLHKNGVPKSILDTAYELAFKEGEELLDELMKRLDEAMAELKSAVEGEKK